MREPAITRMQEKEFFVASSQGLQFQSGHKEAQFLCQDVSLVLGPKVISDGGQVKAVLHHLAMFVHICTQANIGTLAETRAGKCNFQEARAPASSQIKSAQR